MIARDFDGKVESRLHHKDIHIVLAMAQKLGIELPASAAAAKVLTSCKTVAGPEAIQQQSSACSRISDHQIPNP